MMKKKKERKKGKRCHVRMKETRERGKGGGVRVVCSKIPRGMRGWLMTCVGFCPVGDGERKPASLPLFDDTSQLATDISLPGEAARHCE